MEFSARLSALKGTIIPDQVISENFTFTDISTEDMKIVGIKAYGDNRGYFMETYKRLDSIASGIDCELVQGKPIVFNARRAAWIAFSD